MKKYLLLGISVLSIGILSACSTTTTTSSENHDKISSEKHGETETDSQKWLTHYKEFVESYVSFVDKYKKDPTNPDLVSELSKMSTDQQELVSEASKYKDDFTGADLEEYNKLTTQLTEAISKLSEK